MSAVIPAFPLRSPIQALCRASSGAAPFTPAWCDQHLPLIKAAKDMLTTDDAEFAQRCRTMQDEDGWAMLDELADQLQPLGAHIADVADALGLTAARIRDQMAT